MQCYSSLENLLCRRSETILVKLTVYAIFMIEWSKMMGLTLLFYWLVTFDITMPFLAIDRLPYICRVYSSLLIFLFLSRKTRSRPENASNPHTLIVTLWQWTYVLRDVTDTKSNIIDCGMSQEGAHTRQFYQIVLKPFACLGKKLSKSDQLHFMIFKDQAG